MDAKPERIAKVIAAAGVCSRRDAEQLISDGRVRLNGNTLTSPAVVVTAEDVIEVQEEEIGMMEDWQDEWGC